MILVTAFEPFDGRTVNAGAEVLVRLADEVRGRVVARSTLPVSFAAAWPALRAVAEGVDPDALVLLGEAPRRPRVEVERVAVNIADCATPDNDGAAPAGEPIVEDGPAAHLSSTPVHEVVARIRAAGVPADVSDSAGTYVCNQVYYLALHHLAPLPIAFVHLPLLPEQSLADTHPTMAVELAVRAVEVVIDAVGGGRQGSGPGRRGDRCRNER